MFKKQFLLSILSFCILFNTKAYTDKPILIHLDKQTQLDTHGFNLPLEIIQACYTLIIEDKIKLYYSPKKEGVFSIDAFKGIENFNNISFLRIKDVFLHEYWSSNKRKTSFTTIGISFIGNTKTSERVNFGYIDLKEAWGYLSKTLMFTNENGYGETSIADGIYTRRYNYNVVQFGKKSFKKNPEKSFKYKKAAFNNKKELESILIPRKIKILTSYIKKNSADELGMGNLIYTNLNTYLNNNKETILNLDGNKFFDYKTLTEVVITRIETIEIFEKKSTTLIETSLSYVRIFVNGEPLNLIPLSTLLKWNLVFQFKSIEDVVKEKKFEYLITQINSVPVPDNENNWYKLALEKYDWSQITYYVNSYRKPK